MEKQDIDKLEKVIDASKELVAVGEKVFANGKVDWADVEQIPALYGSVEKLIKAFKDYKEIGAEIKDIDGEEAVRLVAKLFM